MRGRRRQAVAAVLDQRCWIAGWLGTTVVIGLMFVYTGIGGAFFGLPLLALFSLCWAGFGVARVIGLARRGDAAASVASGAATVALAILAAYAFHPVLQATYRAVSEIRFIAHRSTYGMVVTDVRAGRERPEVHVWAEARGVRYILDAGPPVRIAFPGPGGFLDNWSGIIWDPTGRVMEANGRFRADPAITGLFGGDLVDCRRMTGPWYDCGFT